MYSYFSVGNGKPMEPALCRLYRHTFVRYGSTGSTRPARFVLCTSGESGKLHWIETGEFDWRRGVHSGVACRKINQPASPGERFPSPGLEVGPPARQSSSPPPHPVESRYNSVIYAMHATRTRREKSYWQ